MRYLWNFTKRINFIGIIVILVELIVKFRIKKNLVSPKEIKENKLNKILLMADANKKKKKIPHQKATI